MKYLIPFILGAALMIGATSALAVGAYAVATGGTGSTTLTGILSGNGTSPIQTVIIGSGCTFSGNTLSCPGSSSSGTISTSTMAVIPNLLYFTGASTVGNVATSTLTPGTGLTGSFTQVGSGGSVSFASIAANSLWVNGIGSTAVPTVIGTSSLGIALANTTGTLPVNRGGTGALTLTGCLTGNGTGAITGSGTCNTSNASVNSVGLSSTNSTLTVGSTPITTSGTMTADINLTHANAWAALQTFAAKVGIASTTPSYQLSVGTVGSTYGSIISVENLVATSTSATIDWSAGNQQDFQIGNSATTIGFSNVIDGGTLRLVVCNPPASSAGAITFNGVEWSGGTTPTQTTTAKVCDIWSFIATQATSTTASAAKIFGALSPNYP